MTILEAITKADDLRSNFFTHDMKVDWLSRLDMTIYNEIIKTHEDPAIEEFLGYSADTDDSTVLIVGSPHDNIYIHYLESMIDYYNGEYEEYNNSNAMFMNAFGSFRNYYNSTHMPISVEKNYF